MEVTKGSRLENGLAAVPILRAGLSMLEPLLELFPDVAVGYIGLERDHETAEASRYYCKLPKLDGKVAVCLDPMLATGGSAAKAIELIKEGGPKRVVMVSVVAAPEGVEKLQAAHPDVPIYTAGLDRQLNPNKYILPGLGDYGDRLYGTQ
ncbi:MAG: uracil phosphoribosyltransferase [Fimbriimonadaceae bacterium]